MEQSLEQVYKDYCVIAQNLILEISKNSNLSENQEVKQKLSQLKAYFDLPIQKESIWFFIEIIKSLKQYIDTIKPVEDNLIEEGRQTGYTKVKKSGNAFIPVEEDSEKKDIEVPNYDNPILETHKRSSLRDYPNYVYRDGSIPVFPATNFNRGSSHILMLAFLTFLFESIFLVLAFFLYR